MTTEGPVRAGFDPLSPAFLADPFAVLSSLPRDVPVFYAPSIDYYVVTRYADIEAVFLDTRDVLRRNGAAPACATRARGGPNPSCSRS